jgi:acyl dehydratase
VSITRGPLYFEDFAAMGPDDEIVTPARTVTEADVVSFAAWTGDYNPLHTDAVAAADTRFGERIAHGVLGVALWIGLTARTGLFEGSAVALLGIDGWTFRAPIRFGDTVHASMRIVGTRLTSSGTTGVVQRHAQLINADDVVVQEGRLDVMVRTQP